jgi:hypothetical protein
VGSVLRGTSQRVIVVWPWMPVQRPSNLNTVASILPTSTRPLPWRQGSYQEDRRTHDDIDLDHYERVNNHDGHSHNAASTLIT